jgi:hypothetical protein
MSPPDLSFLGVSNFQLQYLPKEVKGGFSLSAYYKEEK